MAVGLHSRAMLLCLITDWMDMAQSSRRHQLPTLLAILINDLIPELVRTGHHRLVCSTESAVYAVPNSHNCLTVLV